MRAAFNAIEPDLLVLSIDLAGYDTGAYVKVAHQSGCKVVLISSIMSIGLDQAEVYYNDPNYHVRGLARPAHRARVSEMGDHASRSRPIFRVPAGTRAGDGTAAYRAAASRGCSTAVGRT